MEDTSGLEVLGAFVRLVREAAASAASVIRLVVLRANFLLGAFLEVETRNVDPARLAPCFLPACFCTVRRALDARGLRAESPCCCCGGA